MPTIVRIAIWTLPYLFLSAMLITMYLAMDKTNIATEMQNTSEAKILCWVMVTEPILWTSTVHINNTWCRRCDRVVYYGDVDNEQFPVIGLGTPVSNRTLLTLKRDRAMDHLYRHHIHDADWFLKADSDSYVIMENLRHFLSRFDPEDPLVIGQQWINRGGVPYPAGGGGYVISKEALRRFGERNRNQRCNSTIGAQEEIHLAKCFDNLGVKLVDTKDDKGRTKFHQYNLTSHLRNKLPGVYYRRVSEKVQAVSPDAVSFHYVSTDELYMLEYLIYNLQLHGRT